MRKLSLMLAFILSTMTINASYANARMVSTMEAIDGISLEQDREKVLSFMQADQVQKQLISLGVNPQEAMMRVSSLSSKEISLLSSEIDKASAGGDVVTGILGLAVLVFIVLLITDILGFTKVFPFTRAVQ